MELSIFEICILLFAGAMVGISMSFIGQTGSGIVIPIVFIITGNILLAIAVSLLNDLIAASAVSISYIRNRNYLIRKDNFILIIFAALTAFLGVLLLMTTNLSSAFGLILPIFFMFFGIVILKKGFPTQESLTETTIKLSRKFMKDKKSEEELIQFEKKLKEQLLSGDEIIQGIIPPNSKLFYIAAIIMGIFLGLNAGIFGASGGFIIALVLIILYGYPLKKAVGSALILSIIILLTTFLFYQILGLTIQNKMYFDWTLTLFLGIGAFITGILFSAYVQKLSAKAMGTGMGLVMILLGSITLIVYFLQ
ncbi:MAG: sulfite exporter TauE/SafE family protein [Promethearchaeota archaeon]